jgi:hypothetical protein
MPRRHLLGTLLASLALAGCGGSLDVDEFPRAEGTDLDCKAMLADAPPRVADEDDRRVTDRVAAAWGDPPIILRCGVEKPKALEPTSQCFAVRDVGWLAETTADGYLFTTIGRRFYVSVEVPKAYDPAADALADLAPWIRKHDPEERGCA